MKATKLAFLLPLSILASAIPAFAGDSGYAQRTTYTSNTSAHIHSKWDDRPRAVRILAYPFVFLGRAGESFLHSPQILAEGIEGDRALVNKRGVLAPREVPVEDCIVSPAD